VRPNTDAIRVRRIGYAWWTRCHSSRHRKSGTKFKTQPNRVLLAVVGVAAALAPARATAKPIGLQLVVRVYDASGLAAARLATAHRTAAAVLAGTGIDIVWRDCQTTASPHATQFCHRPVEPGEVIVRVVKAGLDDSDHRLGYSSIDTRHHVDCLATVFGDRVEAVATRTETDAGTLLGRVIVHEVIHLLLGTATHSPIGLMRDSWSDDEMRSNRPIDWMLTRTDAKRVRLGLLERSRRSRQPAPETPRIGHRSPSMPPSSRSGSFLTIRKESLVPAEERADVDLRSDGGNLRLAAATAWHPPGIRRGCPELDTLRFGVPRDLPVSQRLRHRVEILIAYIKQLFSRRAFLEKNDDDSVGRLKRREVCPKPSPRLLA
jgi:hypothetical protein